MNLFTSKLQLVLCAFTAFVVLACSPNKGESGGIKLDSSVPSEQSFYADDIEATGAISFQAGDDWYAEVVYPQGGTYSDEKRFVAEEWLSITPKSGESGKHTISLSMQKNYSGSDRSADVVIKCGESVTVKITQKSITEDGTVLYPEDLTSDGEAPYAIFEKTEYTMPAVSSELYRVLLKTNLVNPRIVVTTDDDDTYSIANIEELVSLGDEWNFSVGIKINTNTFDRELNGHISVLMGNGQKLASVPVTQEAGAVSELLGVTSTVNSLTFSFKAGSRTSIVRYRLSDKELNDNEVRDFIFASEGVNKDCTPGGTFDIYVDNLIPATEYYLYMISGVSAMEHDGAINAEGAMTAMLSDEHDLVLRVSANAANNFTVKLPFADYSGSIDWGDGTTEQMYTRSHTYDVDTPTEFTVRFSGTLHTISSSFVEPADLTSSLIAVEQWGFTQLHSLTLSGYTSLTSIASDTQGAFRGITDFGEDKISYGSFSGTSITSVPAGLFDYAVDATSFDGTFDGCDKLTEIPSELFAKCTSATSFISTFEGCSLLGSIPGDIFKGASSVVSFRYTFAVCKALTSIPEGLFADCSSARYFEGTFYGCSGLIQIPESLFASCPNVEYFGICSERDSGYRGGAGVFSKCTSLSVIPAGIFANNTNARDFSYAFEGCGITSIPANLLSNNKSARYLERMFASCSSLAAIPASLFDNNRNITNVSGLFDGCRSVIGESPYTMVGNEKVHLYERKSYPLYFTPISIYDKCFNGCIGLSDYADIVWK